LVFEIVDSLRQATSMTADALAALLHASEEDVAERFLPGQGGLRIVRGAD
jgi:hypothetical protein